MSDTAKRIVDVLREGGLSRRELASAVGVSLDECDAATKELVDEGIIGHYWQGTTFMFCLVPGRGGEDA